MMIDLKQEKYLQQLVESELSLEEENDAIMQCEQDARLWRSVALAFLEQRRIASALTEWEEGTTTDAVTDFSSTDLFVANRRTARPKSRAMAAMAALVLFALGIGCTFGWHFGNQYAGDQNGTEPARDLAATNQVLVHVIYPDDRDSPSPREFNFGEPILNGLAKDVLRNAGYDVEEIATWRLVGNGPQQRAVPSRELRLTSTR